MEKAGTAPPLRDSKHIHRVNTDREKTFLLSQCFKSHTPPPHIHPWMTDSVVEAVPGDLLGTFNMIPI